MKGDHTMPKLCKFVVGTSSIAMFEEHGDEFRPETIKLNEQISFDPATGRITLRETHATFVEIKTFVPTADINDDPTLYDKDEDVYTDLAGNPIPRPVEHLSNDGIDDDQDHDGSNDDDIDGTSGNDARHGGGGDDNVFGLGGDDSLHGEEGDDDLVGGTGNDDLSGDSGFDALSGGAGEDSLHGGADDDILKGDDGADTLDGGSGNDDLVGGNGDDSMSGGSGNDDLIGGGGVDDVNGGTGDDRLSGGDSNDFLKGGDGKDSLVGGSGNDRMVGGAGDDNLNGGTGADNLRGGSGRDILTGGDGADRFIFDDGDLGASRIVADHITDFTEDQGDRINLSLVDADSTLAGDQAFTFIDTAAFNHVAGELRYEQQNGNTWLYGDQNGDALADFAIRIDGLVTLQAGDFVL
jgi:Ca2+-binding RTX toxin-like protein